MNPNYMKMQFWEKGDLKREKDLPGERDETQSIHELGANRTQIRSPSGLPEPRTQTRKPPSLHQNPVRRSCRDLCASLTSEA